MFRLDFGDHRPIYEQIKEKLKFLIIGGAISPGEKIPSVRELAMSMAVNPNTIQRAYKELEIEGYIYSQAAKGYFVSPVKDAAKADEEKIVSKFSDAVRELMYRGKGKKELFDIIEKLYEGGNL